METVATARETFEAFRDALERGDIDGALEVFADDVVYTIYSERSRPSSAQTVHGKEPVAEIWRPVAENDLTESVSDAVVGDDRFACTVTCTYPTGERVVGNYICEVRDGKIVRSTSVETWDE